MKNSTVAMCLLVLSITLFGFSCSKSDTSNSDSKTSENDSNYGYGSKSNEDIATSCSDREIRKVSGKDREFLEAVAGEKRWSTWNTLSCQKKISIGRSACNTLDNFDAYKDLLSSYGDSTQHISNQVGAATILDVGGSIYCNEAWKLAWKKRNTKARDDFNNKMSDDLMKRAIDLMPKGP